MKRASLPGASRSIDLTGDESDEAWGSWAGTPLASGTPLLAPVAKEAPHGVKRKEPSDETAPIASENSASIAESTMPDNENLRRAIKSNQAISQMRAEAAGSQDRLVMPKTPPLSDGDRDGNSDSASVPTGQVGAVEAPCPEAR